MENLWRLTSWLETISELHVYPFVLSLPRSSCVNKYVFKFIKQCFRFTSTCSRYKDHSWPERDFGIKAFLKFRPNLLTPGAKTCCISFLSSVDVKAFVKQPNSFAFMGPQTSFNIWGFLFHLVENPPFSWNKMDWQCHFYYWKTISICLAIMKLYFLPVFWHHIIKERSITMKKIA